MALEKIGGGDPASHRLDPLGEGMAQMLLHMPIEAALARDRFASPTLVRTPKEVDHGRLA